MKSLLLRRYLLRKTMEIDTHLQIIITKGVFWAHFTHQYKETTPPIFIHFSITDLSCCSLVAIPLHATHSLLL